MGVVGEFGFAKTLQTHVLFAVDENVLFGETGGKLLVDDIESAINVAVGLLDTDVEGVEGDRGSVGEGNHLAVNPDAAAYHVQLVPMCIDILHHLLLGVDGALMVGVVGFVPPQLRQLPAVVEVFWGEGAIFVLGVELEKLVDVVAFGLEVFASQLLQVATQVDVIVVVATGIDVGLDGKNPFQVFGMGVLESQQGEGIAELGGIEAEEFQELHVGGLFGANHIGEVAEEPNTQYYSVGEDAAFGAKPELPSKQVGEGKVAIASTRRQGDGLNDSAVVYAEGLEFKRLEGIELSHKDNFLYDEAGSF